MIHLKPPKERHHRDFPTTILSTHISDSMLPFTIKVTHQVVERLCRITAGRERQNMDVRVDVHAHSRQLLPSFTGRSSAGPGSEALNEAMEFAYEAVVEFLRGIAESGVFLPTNRLNRYPHRLYCLLMSPNSAREVFNVQNASAGNRLTFGDYELAVSRKAQIRDAEAYLIAPNKYTLFMRQAVESRVVNVYRSDFIDLVTNTPPPLHLHAQDVIDAFAGGPAAESERPMEGQQLLMFSPDDMNKRKEKQTVCPKCGGQVQKIGAGRYFCLDCEWDNLPLLK